MYICCRYEDIFNSCWMYIARTWRYWNVSPDASYYPISALVGSGVVEGFAIALQLVAQSQNLWRIYPQLPRTSCHTSARKDSIGVNGMAYNWLLHPCCSRCVVVGAIANDTPRHRNFVAYSIVQNTEKIGIVQLPKLNNPISIEVIATISIVLYLPCGHHLSGEVY